jgi:YVTN family beta-propeller protein
VPSVFAVRRRLVEIQMTKFTLLVLHKEGHSLGYYDVETGRQTAEVATSDFPHEMCLHPDRNRLYIAEYGLRGVETPGKGGNTVAILDVGAKSIVGRISTGEYDRPHGIAAHSRGRLCVTSETRNSLLVFDLGSGQELAAIDVRQETPHMTAVAPEAMLAFTANMGSNALTAIDLESFQVLRHVPVLSRPEGMAFSPCGGRLYVTNRESAAVVVVDCCLMEMSGRIETGKGPVRAAMSPDGARLVVPLFFQDALQILDLGEGRVANTVQVGRQPAGAAVSPDGTLAFASCELEDAVYVIDLEGGRVVDRIGTRKGPDAMVCLAASEVG